jgi:hypothetical protein
MAQVYYNQLPDLKFFWLGPSSQVGTIGYPEATFMGTDLGTETLVIFPVLGFTGSALSSKEKVLVYILVSPTSGWNMAPCCAPQFWGMDGRQSLGFLVIRNPEASWSWLPGYQESRSLVKVDWLGGRSCETLLISGFHYGSMGLDFNLRSSINFLLFLQQ